MTYCVHYTTRCKQTFSLQVGDKENRVFVPLKDSQAHSFVLWAIQGGIGPSDCRSLQGAVHGRRHITPGGLASSHVFVAVHPPYRSLVLSSGARAASSLWPSLSAQRG